LIGGFLRLALIARHLVIVGLVHQVEQLARALADVVDGFLLFGLGFAF
jgi:hypothetical protein